MPLVTLENHFVIKGTNAGILNAPQRFKKDRFLPLATCQTWRRGCQIVEYDFLTLRCHWFGRVLTVTCIVVLFLEEEIFQLL